MAPQSPAFPLDAEELSVSRQQIVGDTIQVSIVTREGEGVVDEMLNHERVEIDRVPIGRPVDAIPPVRQGGRNNDPADGGGDYRCPTPPSALSAFMFRNAIRKLWSCGSRKQ
jgi:hypothetical protein